MTDKIQHVLDGELPVSVLNAQEMDVLASTADALDGVLNTVPRSAGVDLAPAVLARIRAHQQAARAAQPSRWRSALSWLWSPRPLSLQWRPAYAFAVVALIAIAVTIANPLNNTTTVTTPTQQVLVQFRLDAPDAQQVRLAGNFTSWKATVAMKRSAAGVWTVVLPLTPGVHDYAFVIDGDRWMPDPMAQPVSDGFGGTNSQVAVLTPDNTAAL